MRILWILDMSLRQNKLIENLTEFTDFYDALLDVNAVFSKLLLRQMVKIRQQYF